MLVFRILAAKISVWVEHSAKERVDPIIVDAGGDFYLGRDGGRHSLQHDVSVWVNVPLIDLLMIEIVPEDDSILLKV